MQKKLQSGKTCGKVLYYILPSLKRSVRTRLLKILSDEETESFLPYFSFFVANCLHSLHIFGYIFHLKQNIYTLKSTLRNRSRNRNRRNRIILTQEEPEPEPYPCSRFRFRFRLRFLLQKNIKLNLL
jgi:hypothetical protein